MYLFDTDTLSNLLDEQRNHPLLRNRVLHTDASLIFISIISVEELLRRILPRIQDDRNTPRVTERYMALLRLLEQISAFQVVPFDADALQIFAAIPNAVRQHHPNDCRIAAIAMSCGYKVVTGNVRHFAKIPGVDYEDWMLAETLQADDNELLEG